MVLYHYGFDGEALWRWSTVLGLVVAFVYFGYMLSLTTKLSWSEFKEAGVAHMVSSYALGFLAFGLLVANLLGEAGPGHYILASLALFAIAIIGFVTFSLQKVLRW